MSDFEEGMAVGLAIGRKKFSGGNGGDTPSEEKWTYPADWLPLPEIGENEVAALIFVRSDIIARVGFYNITPDSVDWGDPNSSEETAASHTYEFERGVPFSDNTSMFVMKAHFQPGTFSGIDPGNGFITACAVDGSAIDPTIASISVVNNQRSYLQYLKITGDMTNFGERQNFIYAMDSLKRVDFENSPSKLASHTFQACRSLNSINMPDLSAVESAADYCFYSCASLDEINMPALRTVGNYFCCNCYTLEKISLPSLETAGNNFLSNCFTISSSYLPALQSIGQNGLYYCYGLESADLSSLTTITNNDIGSYCCSLRRLSMPNIDITQSGIFPQSYMIK